METERVKMQLEEPLENALQFLKTGNTLKVFFLPDGEDPDSFIRQHGKEAFERKIAESIHLSRYLFDNLIDIHQLNLGSNEGKSALRAHASAMIEKIPDPFFQELLDKLLDERTGFDNNLRKPRKKSVDVATQPHTALKRTPMREVIALLIQNPSYAEMVPNLSSVADLPVPGLSLFIEVLEYCHKRPNISSGQLLECWRDTRHEALLSRLAGWNIPVEDDNEQDIFLDSLDKILAQCVEKQIEDLQAKERSIGLSTEERRELLALMLDLKA